MSLRNKVTLIGRTGREVEITTFENGQKGSVTLATTDFYKDAKGEKVEDTQWHNLVAFGNTADILNLANKGQEIAVEGKIVNRSYEDKEGITRYISEIRVEEILLLGSKKTD